MRKGRLGLLALLVLGACATQPKAPPMQARPPRAVHAPAPSPAPSPVAPRPAPVPVTKPAVAPPPPLAAEVKDLPGWAAEDHAAAFTAFRAGCHAAPADADHRACADADRLGQVDETAARRFFEDRFRAERVEAQGLLTGYFAPEYEARTAPDAEFSGVLRPRPADLKRGPDGHFPPYRPRAAIEADTTPGLAYLRPEDLFFLQIQGSGYLHFPNGTRRRAAYAADNGLPFTGIAKPLVAQGLMQPGETSGDGIRKWLADHRGPQARAITDLDPRYVFFALQPDDGASPAGSAGVPLPPGRSAAVDRKAHGMGELLWLDSEGGPNVTTFTSGIFVAPTYRRLVVALDEGGAIKGPARADLYVGRGAKAGAEAGRIKQPLRLWRLVPKDR